MKFPCHGKLVSWGKSLGLVVSVRVAFEMKDDVCGGATRTKYLFLKLVPKTKLLGRTGVTSKFCNFVDRQDKTKT